MRPHLLNKCLPLLAALGLAAHSTAPATGRDQEPAAPLAALQSAVAEPPAQQAEDPRVTRLREMLLVASLKIPPPLPRAGQVTYRRHRRRQLARRIHDEFYPHNRAARRAMAARAIPV